MFLGKGVLKICSKFTGEHPCQSVISIELLYNFIEIALRHGCSLINLLHIFRAPFPKNSVNIRNMEESNPNTLLLDLKIAVWTEETPCDPKMSF